MIRTISRLTSLLLLVFAGSACGDYSTGSGYQGPPDTSRQNGLWVVSGTEPALVRLSTEQLAASGSVIPSTVITTTTTSFTLNSVAFDAAGTMWMSSPGDSSLLAFDPSALASSGDRTATRVISSHDGSLNASSAIAFDASHHLWVANHGNGTIVRFDSAQLAASGAPAPTIVLSGLGHPTGLAFDAGGNLWFSDNQGNRLAMFSVAQLSASGFTLPAVVLNTNGTTLRNPSGIAFDDAGKLWVANVGTQTIIAFGPDQLDTTALANPSIVISPTTTSPALPVGLAFDASGNLWVVDGVGVLAKYDHVSLAASGAPAPDVRVVLTNHLNLWIPAFWPKPPRLPLH
jgi:sugar lactone lactonase YvrE